MADKLKPKAVTPVRSTTHADTHWGGLGRWAFLEVTHMENAADLIRSRFLVTLPTEAGT